VGVVKLGIGIGVTWQGTSKVTSEIVQTKQAIAQTYDKIRSSEGLSFQLPEMGMSLLIALSGLVLLGMVKKFSSPSIGDGKDEIQD
jgi:hypothetical protein